MKFSYFLPLFLVSFFCTKNLVAQCPTNEADLADGGSFSGTCNVGVGGSITIAGIVNWNSGTLSITGNNGDVNVTGTLNILGGTFRAIDGNDGDLDVLSGGSINVSNGATLTIYQDIQVQSGGSMTVNGTVTSTTSFFDIDNGGSVTVTSTGSITTGANDDFLVQGTLINDGVIDIGNEFNITGTVTNSGDIHADADIVVDGGSLTVESGGTMDSDDDLRVIGGGTVTVDNGGSIAVLDDVANSVTGTTGTPEQGTIILNGTMTAGDAVFINDTTPNSGLSGSGTITATGVFTDNEAGPYSTCTGGGAPCDPVILPVKLVHFSGTVSGGEAVLRWATGEEVNNEGFYIEKSLDGRDFETIGFVEGNGTTIEKIEYSFSDEHLGKAAYYRLRQVDYDGVFEVFKVIYLHAAVSSSINLYPNPSNSGIVTLQIEGLDPDSTVQVMVFDPTGAVVYDQMLSASKAELQLPSTTVNGVYLVKVNTGAELVVERLIVNR